MLFFSFEGEIFQMTILGDCEAVRANTGNLKGIQLQVYEPWDDGKTNCTHKLRAQHMNRRSFFYINISYFRTPSK